MVSQINYPMVSINRYILILTIVIEKTFGFSELDLLPELRMELEKVGSFQDYSEKQR